MVKKSLVAYIYAITATFVPVSIRGIFSRERKLTTWPTSLAKVGTTISESLIALKDIFMTVQTPVSATVLVSASPVLGNRVGVTDKRRLLRIKLKSLAAEAA